MRLSRLACLGILAVGLGGCREDGSIPSTPIIPPLAFVRYINAVPDTLNTTVRWIDQVEYVPQSFVNVPYRGLGQGNYQGVQIAAKKLRIFTTDVANFSAAGNTVVLVDTSLTLEAGKYYTLLHSGFARAGASPRQGLRVIEDVFPSPGANIAVRFINAGLGFSAMDYYALPTATSPITGPPTVSALASGAIAPYSTRTAGPFATVLTAAGATTALFSTTAPVGVAGNPATPAANGVPAIAAVDPIAGSTVPGSVLTAIAFPASVAGSPASSFTAPAIVYFLDKQPPRFNTP